MRLELHFGVISSLFGVPAFNNPNMIEQGSSQTHLPDKK